MLPPPSAAALLIAFLEHHGWRVFLDDDGLMTVRVGAAVPDLAQETVFSLLEQMESDVIATLVSLRTTH